MTKSTSIHTLKPSNFVAQKHVNSRTHTKNKPISTPRTKAKLISTPTLTLSQFRSLLWIKSFSTPTQNQVNHDPYTEIKSIPILHIEIKSISTTRTNQVNVDANTKTMSISAGVSLDVIISGTCSCDKTAMLIT